jgi:hypothetical protein
MSCPKHIWDRSIREGISLSELGKRGALKRASNKRKEEQRKQQQALFIQLELFRAHSEH